MTRNESSPPCEERCISFNDDGQSAVGLTRVTSFTWHMHVQTATNYTPPPSPSRNYYPWLIVGTKLPTQKGWIAWLAKADCTHITFAQGYYTIESKDTRTKWTQVVGSKTNSIQWTNRAIHYRPRIKSQKTTRSAVELKKAYEANKGMTIKMSRRQLDCDTPARPPSSWSCLPGWPR